MDTIMYKALSDAAYTAWYRNAVSGKLNGANVIHPGNSTGVWAGHLLVDVLQTFEPDVFVLHDVIYIMRDYRELPACVIMHEVGHVVKTQLFHYASFLCVARKAPYRLRRCGRASGPCPI